MSRTLLIGYCKIQVDDPELVASPDDVKRITSEKVDDYEPTEEEVEKNELR